MQIYLVGGAVRDRLLGLPVTERDWVVIGGSGDELKALGYQRVGRSFPVYLHPETQEEYALGRTETKTGPGYRGFEVHADPDVTLEQDLARRDLTINAIAQTKDGELIDPYGGQRDLENRLLRHVSDAFREDPVRVLRAARFAARFHEQGFRLAEETLALMRDMVAAGEVDTLIPERIWKETLGALSATRPDIFFRVLRATGALRVIYPELDALFGVPQPERWHPEIDTGEHTLMVLLDSANRNCSDEVRFAGLVHDLGKGTTPKDQWPRHIGHEQRSVKLIKKLCTRIGVPNRFRDLAVPVALYHGLSHRVAELRPLTILKVLEALDVFRRPQRLDEFLSACKADARGRTGHKTDDYPQAKIFITALEAACKVRASDLAEQGLTDKALGAAIRDARITAIAEAVKATG